MIKFLPILVFRFFILTSLIFGLSLGCANFRRESSSLFFDISFSCFAGFLIGNLLSNFLQDSKNGSIIGITLAACLLYGYISLGFTSLLDKEYKAHVKNSGHDVYDRLITCLLPHNMERYFQWKSYHGRYYIFPIDIWENFDDADSALYNDTPKPANHGGLSVKTKWICWGIVYLSLVYSCFFVIFYGKKLSGPPPSSTIQNGSLCEQHFFSEPQHRE